MSEPSIIKFVAKLQDLGVKLTLEAGELKVKAPSGILQGELLAQLKEKKHAVQEYIQILSAAQKKSKSKITPADRAQALPLSYGQQRLWFLDQLSIQKNNRGNVFYNMPMVLKIEGELNLPHFEASVKKIITRHEILRTNFVQNETALCQLIHKEVNWAIDIIDLRLDDIASLSEENIKKKISKLINDLCVVPFDLANDLLFRIHLIRVSEECSYFVNVMHHIIGDAWSSEILFRELVSVYLFGEASLPKLDIQYADYAVWQREWLSGDVLTNEVAFWKTELSDVPVLLLPFDRTRPAFESHRGARVKISIENDLYKRIKQFSEKNSVTLFMTFMASFQLLLFRYSGQADFAVGTPVANRDKEELSNQLGFFINTLAIRSCTEADISFLDLIAKVKNRLLNAYSHQELPFEQIVESLKLERSTSHAPVFQTMLVLNSSSFANQKKSGVDTSAIGKSDLAKLKISMLESEHVSAKFDLNCELVESDQNIFGHFEYNTDLFDEQTILQMAKHFLILLDCVIQNPSENISAIKFLEKDLSQQISHHSQGPSVLYTAYDSVSAYLNAVLLAEANKNLSALRFAGHSLSYAELHRRSERLASYLQINNLKTKAPVALCFDRSIDMVVSLLAVIKAGSPYLPLDPELPQERLEFMLKDSAAQFVLTQEAYAHRFTQHAIINSCVVNLDNPTLQKEIAATTISVVNHAKPHDIFNIIYTSGSTGNPKGVMLTHAGILNRIQWMQAEYQLKPSDKVLQKTTYSFDVSVWEFIWPLSQGACLVLAKPEGHKDPEYLKHLMHSEQISHCHFVPSMLQIWLEQEGLSTLRALQKVFCSGEALSREAVNNFYQALPDCELHNLYGPTEAAIDVSYWHCEKDLASLCSVPIGRPVANTQLWVLDKQGHLLPPGVAGELHIGGVQVAKGYVNRDELTRASFIEHIIDEKNIDGQKHRLYKTGDLVRQGRDGVLEYLGRIDHQIKIRGYRIELGEIESRLQSIEGVALSVVLADNLSENKSQADSSDQQLIAYVSTHYPIEQKEEFIATIKQELSQHLPAYMVPSVVLVLDEMPLLNNGKINRKRLPKAEFEQAIFIAPSTDTERALAQIWQEVLGVEKIGIHDNFFELGGHSLLATRVLSKAKNVFEKEIFLLNIFEYPLLQNFASYIDGLAAGKAQADIKKIDRSLPLPLSYSQQRIWFLEQLNPGSVFYHIPAVLKLEGKFNVKHFEECVKNIIQRHESLRTVFRSADGEGDDEAKQVILSFDDWHLDLVRLNSQNEAFIKDESILKEKAAELLLLPFDLKTGHLFRIHILQVDAQNFYLLAVMHHIISDAWSIEILLKEIVTAYLVGASNLPPLEIQYADYAFWQRSELSEVLHQQERYWCEQLKDTPALQLPFDRIRPPLESHRGSALSFELDKAFSQELRIFSKQQGVTLFMTLMAAYQVLLSRYSGQTDFAVGTPIANRNHQQVENLIGCFINTLAIRANIEEKVTFKMLLAQVKQTSLAAFSNQELPFEKIVDALKVARNLSHAPIFQVMLVLNTKALQQQVFEASQQAELKVSLLASERLTAKFDLNMELSDFSERSSGKNGGGGKISGHLEYNTDLFDADTAQQILKHFKVLLKNLIKHSEEAIDSLPFLLSEETEILKAHSHGPSIVYPAYHSVTEYLSSILHENKNLCALRFEGSELSYAELHQRSERLASYLQINNLKAKAPVALCFDRSIDMVLSLLAVIKAGSPYLPLDPELPQERLEFMLKDSAAQFVLTQEAYAHRFTQHAIINSCVVNLDNPTLQKEIAATTISVVNHAKPHDIFNIIYTSGSTGNPKGVMLTHAGILNRIQWMQAEYQLKPSDKVLQKTTYSFDVSVWEFILPLSQGACLVLAKPEGHKDPEYLKHLMHSEQISHCHFVPSMLQIWLEQEGLSTLRALQKVFCSGEALSREAVNNFYQALPDCELHNLYGPTEAAIDVSYWHCIKRMGEKNLASHCSVPIGRPVANTQLWVLDKHGHLVPPGVAGELHIGGVQVAKGYVNRDELTRASFIEHIIDEKNIDGQKHRLYKTGDLVRQGRDGVLEYLGRIDHQIKIRGYRIELGEIESRLQSIEGVALSVVLADNLSENKSQVDSSDQQLIAYVSTHYPIEQKAEFIATIKQELSKHLPAYMVPSVVLVLDEMPLLNNGKINRKRLPKAEFEQAIFIAPSTNTELAIAEIWQEVLGVEKIGIHDNFFELGGHSLLATRVASRIKNKFNVTLALVELFNFTQLKTLAEFIDTLLWAKQNLSKNTSSSASGNYLQEKDLQEKYLQEKDEREEFEL